MAKRKRAKPRRPASKKPKRAPVDDEPSDEPAPAKPPRDWKRIGRDYALLLLGAVMMFLGFAGFGLWPFAFVGMVPALWVMDESQPTGWGFFGRALFFGYVAWYGGFYWVVDTIVDFGGFPYLLAAFFASVFFLYQAMQYVLVLWLYRRARVRGWDPTLALVAAFVGVEVAFPQLFENYYGNSFHMLPYLVQVADLGGALLLSALAMLGNGAVYSLLRAWLEGERRWPKVAPAAFAIAVLFTVGYSAYRIGEVEGRMADAPTITVGVVQTNMGIFEKREDPGEGLRRHLEQSAQLEAQGVDLLVWPESAATFSLPRGLGVPVGPQFDRALMFYREDNPGFPQTPLLFGGLSMEHDAQGERTLYNTAFLTDGEGRIVAHYDKTYLLAFGEYLPFGETFPILYEWSPNTGHFTPGDHVRSLPFGEHRIGALVCYEDIVSRFVRSMMNEDEPNLFVNITNDAWFGDTQEPWVHLALAEMRSVEHHRYLVRATNTGVSAVIDPLGRTIAHTDTFERASLREEVHMLEGGTLYGVLGNWPGWVALIGIGFMALVRRRRRDAPTPLEKKALREGKDDEEE